MEGPQHPAEAERGGPFADGTVLGLRYYAFRSAAWLTERLPLGLTEAAADAAGRASFRLSPRKREVVRRNLARVLRSAGGASAGTSEAEVPVREAYISYARYWLETFRLGRYSREDILEMVDATGFEIVDAALASGTGLLVVLPHFGFWDLLGAWAGAKGYPLTTVGEVLKPRVLFDWFVGIREGVGLKILPSKPGTQALRGLLRALHGGEVAALVADRDLGRRGVWVQYFGEATTAPVGPALLAVRTGAPLASVACYQVGRRRYRCEVAEIPYERTGNEKADIEAVAQVIASALEKVIRKAPEQYHLFSTNWPSDEPGLPPRGRQHPDPAAHAPDLAAPDLTLAAPDLTLAAPDLTLAAPDGPPEPEAVGPASEAPGPGGPPEAVAVGPASDAPGPGDPAANPG